MAKRSAAIAGPVMQSPTAETPAESKSATVKGFRPGWCKFKAKARCYVAGVQLESEQEITMSPADSYEQRENKNLELIEGVIPEKQAEDGQAEIEEGDPKVGQSPEGFRLLRPA